MSSGGNYVVPGGAGGGGPFPVLLVTVGITGSGADIIADTVVTVTPAQVAYKQVQIISHNVTVRFDHDDWTEEGVYCHVEASNLLIGCKITGVDPLESFGHVTGGEFGIVGSYSFGVTVTRRLGASTFGIKGAVNKLN